MVSWVWKMDDIWRWEVMAEMCQSIATRPEVQQLCASEKLFMMERAYDFMRGSLIAAQEKIPNYQGMDLGELEYGPGPVVFKPI